MDLKTIYKALSKEPKKNALALGHLRNILSQRTKSAQEEAIMKAAISTGIFTHGGQLNALQQNRFLTFVRNFSTMLKLVRIKRMQRPSEDIDKLWVGEPITKPATEGATTGRSTVSPELNKITLSTTKVRSDWEINTETIQQAISQDEFEKETFDAYMIRLATDLELLGVQGDDTLTGTDPTNTLLAIKDGWYIQSLNGHVVDAGGATVSKGIFGEMWKAMPQQYRKNPNLKYFVSSGVHMDWMDLVSDRPTASGDIALFRGGQGASVYGKQIIPVELIPDDLSITVGNATPAYIKGTQKDPFTLTSGMTVIVDVNAGGLRTTTLAANVYNVSQIAASVNATLAANSDQQVATDNGFGQLVFRTQTTGTGATLTIGSGTANTVLGLTTGQYDAGSAASSSNSDYNGSFIWLTDPKNFIMGILEGTRIYSEFLRLTDQIAVTTYNQVDYKIENIDAVVVATNVQLRSLF